jgi:hypothetical protein
MTVPGVVGGVSLGPGAPQPVSYGYRQPSLGKPSIAFEPGSGQVRTTVAQGKGGAKLSASFQFRSPPTSPGTQGVGAAGARIDVRG